MSGGGEPVQVPRLWHVTLTVGGEPVPVAQIRAGLERLGAERPFMLDGRYAPDRAQLRYWEEAEYLEDAAAMALRLWGEHRVSAGLPRWEVLGLEVLEQQAHQRRATATDPRSISAAGLVRPF